MAIRDTKDWKRSREKSLKKWNSSSKIIEVIIKEESKDAEKEEEHKGKCSYIASIIGGARRTNIPSRVTININVIKLMVVINKEGISLAANPERPIHGF